MASKAAAFVVSALVLFSLSVFGLDRSPEAVSPGELDRLVRIRDGCPAFSWGAVPGAGDYELVVYALGEDDGEGESSVEPEIVLQKTVPGSALSWTPALESCLEPGGHYAWVVRVGGDGRLSEWSEARLFEVASGPSEADFKRALEVVRSYLSAREGTVDQRGERTSEPEPRSGDVLAKARALKDLAKPKATSSAPFSVDGSGNVQGASFTGDGAALTNVSAVDLVGTSCVSESELDFDPATQTELTAHTALASAHHSPTVDTTCSGAACDGTLFTNVSATDLLCTACVSEPDLDFDPATQVELGAHAASGDHDARYYTESELNTSGGGASVHWSNLTNRPAGLDDGDDDTTYTAGSALALSPAGEFSVASLGITALKLATNSVNSNKIVDQSVGSADLAPGAVGTGHLQGLAVATGKLADNSVTGAKVADGAITSADVGDKSLSATDLQNGLRIRSEAVCDCAWREYQAGGLPCDSGVGTYCYRIDCGPGEVLTRIETKVGADDRVDAGLCCKLCDFSEY